MKIFLVLSCFVLLFPFAGYSQLVDIDSCSQYTWDWATSIVTSEVNSYRNTRDIKADPAGNLFVAGTFMESIILGDTLYETSAGYDNDRGNTDGYVVKYNTSGELIWSTHLASTSTGDVIPSAVTTDQAGNLYIMGTFREALMVGDNVLFSHDNLSDVFVAKFNTTQTLEWVKQFGGSGSDTGGDIVVSQSGRIFISGVFSGTATIGGQPYDSDSGKHFVLQLNSSGEPLWFEQFDNPASSYPLLAVKPNNNIIVGGVFTDTLTFLNKMIIAPQGNDFLSPHAIFLSEITSAGDLLWLSEVSSGKDSVASDINIPTLAVDREGDIYLGGRLNYGELIIGDSSYTERGGLIAKFDKQGTPMWSKKIGSAYANDVSGIAFDSNNYLYYSGLSDFGSNWEFKGYLTKSSPEDGKELITWKTGDFSYEREHFLTSDKAGAMYLTGFFENSLTLGEHKVTVQQGFKDVFVAKLDPAIPVITQQPAKNPYEISIENSSSTSIDISWTGGNGDGSLVIVKKMGVVTTSKISDGEQYDGGTEEFGTGTNTGHNQYVVYNGNGNSTTLEGLKPNHFYTVTVVEYNQKADCPSSINYKTDNNVKAHILMKKPKGFTSRLQIFPNPVKNDLNVIIETSARGNRNLTLLDHKGRFVANFPISIKRDVNYAFIDLAPYNLKPGLYYLRLEGDPANNVFRMIKKR